MQGKKHEDLTGERFGMLTAIERIPNYKENDQTYYRCICDCGNEITVIRDRLVQDKITSCGCVRRVRKEALALEKAGAKRKWQSGLDNGKREKPVNQYDLEGHYIKSYGSIAEAKRATGIANVSQALSSSDAHRTSGGFQWRYDTGDHADIPPYHRGKEVFMIDPITKLVISKYPSVAVAERKTGINKTEISFCCCRKRKAAGGYLWRYMEDFPALPSENEEWLKNSLKKPVNQYDLEGHYLKTYDSVAEAKRSTDAPAIGQAANPGTSHRSSGGYQWRYDTGNHEDIPPLSRRRIAVCQIDPKTCQLIATYQSLADAAKATGSKSANIYHACIRNIKTSGGYVWRYEDDLADFSSEDTETKDRRKKPVNQYDLDGHYLKTYNSLVEARRATGAPAISLVLLPDSDHKSSGGYQWRYDTGNHGDITPLSHQGRAVIQIDPRKYQMMTTYPPITEAAKSTGVNAANISRTCKRGIKTAGGYIWRFADDPDAFERGNGK